MANENANNEINVNENIDNKVDKTPVEETVNKAEYDRLKSALDKALKEKGEVTKQLRAKQSDDERLMAEKAEADRVHYIFPGFFRLS